MFAHLPLILKPNGKGKLSKRDGDKYGFPVFPIDWKDPKTEEIAAGYRETGYLPQAVINIIAFLGWNPGTDEEIYTIDKLINEFDLSKVQKGGAKFDPEKAKWFNQQHLKLLSTEELTKIFVKDLKTRNLYPGFEFIQKVVELVRERAAFAKDLWDLSSFFFVAPTEYDRKATKKNWKEPTPEIIKNILNLLKKENNFSSQNLEDITKKWIEENELGFGKVLNPIRLLIVGATKGPHLFDIIEMIGKDEFIKRIETGLEKI